MRTLSLFLLLAAVSTYSSHAAEIEKHHPLRLWYKQPASSQAGDKEGWENSSEWLKALPIGNGFLGGMVFGDVNRERIQLNEKSLWSGSPSKGDNPNASAALDSIRRLLFDGKYKEATDFTLKTQVCAGLGSGHGSGANVPFGCYQTLGDLQIDFGRRTAWKDYRRELDLEKGIASVSYRQDGVQFSREIFASFPDRALVLRLDADRKGQIGFVARLIRPERYAVRQDGQSLLMSGTLTNGNGGDGMRYAARLKVVAFGGSVRYLDSAVVVVGANSAILFVTAATDYRADAPENRGPDPETVSSDQMANASVRPYFKLFDRHVEDYSSLAGRVTLNLSHGDPDTLSTDERLQTQNARTDDLRLVELYFQFGRYLLISSSRKGSLPANLQGIWANQIQTPWNGDYHTDINVQMNYWPADPANLPDCYDPLVNLITSLVKPGGKTAAIQYKAKGWVVHPITNVWGFTSPGEHPGWGMHVGASGWLCGHLWDHYTYTMNQEYLREVYPVMLGAARFYLDWLVKDPRTGKLVSGPASSPENAFIAPDSTRTFISMGPSHDQEVISELFANVLEAASILEDEDSLLADVRSALALLARPKIGSDGRLMEWSEEFQEPEPTHRHVSHLYMLHPGNQVDPDKTPDLAAAVRKTLEKRTDNGTGWSLAWKVNFWARLRDGNRAYKLLKGLLRPVEVYGTDYSSAGGTYANLFCAHPPFQIDGNFGGTSGIAEMLLQSHIKEGGSFLIRLLPAIPDAWGTGSVHGLKARGGFEVSIEWNEGKLQSCEILSLAGQPLNLRWGSKTFSTPTQAGERYVLDGDLEPITR